MAEMLARYAPLVERVLDEEIWRWLSDARRTDHGSIDFDLRSR